MAAPVSQVTAIFHIRKYLTQHAGSELDLLSDTYRVWGQAGLGYAANEYCRHGVVLSITRDSAGYVR